MVALFAVILLVVFLANKDRFVTKKPTVTPSAAPAVSTEKALVGEDGYVIGSDLSAFLGMTGFFDETGKTPTVGDFSEETISLLVTSEERDIRIRVVNEEKKIITGLPVVITVKGIGEYKDLDRDGILIITGVEPGTYYVSLEALEGYRTNADFVSVKVDAVAQNRMIEDIDYLITKETDLIRVQSDGRLSLAAKENKDKEQPLRDTDNAQKGVRLSSKDQNVDFYILKSQGIDFVILRAGYRGYTNGCIYEDAMFAEYAKAAIAAGLKVGAVFESQAINHLEAIEEASAALYILRDLDIAYPVLIDIEQADGLGRADGLDMETRTEICKAFAETVQSEGYTAGVEGSVITMAERVAPEALQKYHLCVDDYSGQNNYSDGSYQFWQYTSMGTIEGLSGLYDLLEGYLGY